MNLSIAPVISWHFLMGLHAFRAYTMASISIGMHIVMVSVAAIMINHNHLGCMPLHYRRLGIALCMNFDATPSHSTICMMSSILYTGHAS